MIPLLLLATAWGSPPCEAPVQVEVLGAALRDGLYAGRWSDVAQVGAALPDGLECVSGALTRPTLARLFQLGGIAAERLGDDDLTSRLIVRALTLSPEATLDAVLVDDLHSEVTATWRREQAEVQSRARAELRLCQAATIDGEVYAANTMVQVRAGDHLVHGGTASGVRAGRWVTVAPRATLTLGSCRAARRELTLMIPAPRSRAPITLEPDRAIARAAAVVRAALSLLGAPAFENGVRYDCSGFVEAVFARAGLPHRGDVQGLYRLAADHGLTHRRRIPTPGDLAFFRATYSRDDTGLVTDQLTHVGIVVSVSLETGTIDLVHKGSSGVVKTVMNLRTPDVGRTPDGAEANTRLAAAGYNPRSAGLTGQLWEVFGSVWRLPPP